MVEENKFNLYYRYETLKSDSDGFLHEFFNFLKRNFYSSF